MIQRLYYRAVAYWKIRRSKPGLVSRPAFVMGSQRAGTTMLVLHLERSPDVHLFNEDNSVAFSDYHLRDLSLIRRLVESSPTPVVLFKPLVDTYRMHQLLKTFSDALVLFAIRHYGDTVNSMLHTFGADPAHRVQRWVQSGFAEQPRFRATGWNGSQSLYADMFEVTKSGLDTPSWTALYWLIQTGFLFELGMADDPRVKVIEYYRLVTQPDQSFRDICGLLGIEYSPLLIDGIHRKAVAKAASPLLDPGVEMLCQRQWDRLMKLAE